MIGLNGCIRNSLSKVMEYLRRYKPYQFAMVPKWPSEFAPINLKLDHLKRPTKDKLKKIDPRDHNFCEKHKQYFTKFVGVKEAHLPGLLKDVGHICWQKW